MNPRRLAALVVAVLGTALAAHAEPVARVEGPRGAFEISAERLAAYRADHPERSAREALDDLIEFELLAAEAAAAGVDGPAVDMAGDRAMVARWLRAAFEPAHTAESIPEDLLRQSYQQNKRFFDHPPLRVADHVVITTADGTRPTGALDETARRFAEQIHTALVEAAPADREAFRAAAGPLTAEPPEGLLARAENLGRFAEKGRYAAEFTREAFALAEGTIGAPFATRFGWHVVRVDEAIPEKRQSFADAEAELRARFAPEARQIGLARLFARLVDALPPLREAQGIGALVNPTPLDALAARRGMGAEPAPE